MKVSDLYAKTKRWMFDKASSTVYSDYIVEITNLVLAELFDENNMCRMWNGKKPLESIPVVTSLDDDVDYEEEYLLHVVPMGMDAYFMIDDDLAKHSLYLTFYNNARVQHQKMMSYGKIEAIVNAED